MTQDFNVISLFSGCGGSSLGYHMAGGNVLCAVEKEKHAANNYELNFTDTELFQQDICKITSKDLLNAAGLDAGELDILDGSPPCQGFSICGARNPKNPKNQLYLEYIRMLSEISPKAFVMENVTGMLRPNMRSIYRDILNNLQKSGYHVFVKSLNAMNYGVAQSRNRLIFTGVRNDLWNNNMDFPNSVFPNPQDKVISSQQALENVPFDEKYFINNEIIRNIWEKAKFGEDFDTYVKNKYFDCTKLNPYKPSTTIKAYIRVNGQSGLFHWEEPRFMTINELKRLQSFPDSFRLEGNFIKKWECIGNSVPPLMMKEIAKHVNKTFLCNEVNT